jgi:hypothetical protein
LLELRQRYPNASVAICLEQPAGQNPPNAVAPLLPRTLRCPKRVGQQPARP